MEYDSNSKHFSFITHHNSYLYTARDMFRGILPDLVHCLFRSRNFLRCLTAPCLPLCPSFLPEVQGKMVCIQGLFYPTAKTWAAYVLWELRLQIAPMSAVHSALWTQPKRTAQNGKNSWVIHCQHIT